MTSPYLLPAGRVQIAFSGGRSSGFMLHQIAEANGGIPEDRVEVLFTNTGRERAETLDFVAECGRRWGVFITWVEYRADAPGFAVTGRQGASEDGAPFRELVLRKRFAPNVVKRFCTEKLKIIPARRYLRAQGWRAWSVAIGFRADEGHRALRGRPEKSLKRWFPMIAAGVTKRDVAAFWRAQPFDIALANVRGATPEGNCDGCFLKSQKTLAALARDHPARAQWWADLEAELKALVDKPQGAQFRKGESWAQLIDYVDRQGDWIFDAEDALCQADGGECIE